MTSEVHAQMEQLYAVYQRWRCNLFVPSFDTKHGCPMLHDICEHLLYRVSFQFPPNFMGPEVKDELVVSLKLSALCSGFCLYTRSTETSATSEHAITVRLLQCEQGEHYHRPHRSRDDIEPLSAS